MPESRGITELFTNLLNAAGGKEGIALSAVTGGIGGPVGKGVKTVAKVAEEVPAAANLLNSLASTVAAPFKLARASRDLTRTLGVSEASGKATAALWRQAAGRRVPKEMFGSLDHNGQAAIGHWVDLAERRAAKLRTATTPERRAKHAKVLGDYISGLEHSAELHKVGIDTSDLRRLIMQFGGS